MAVIVGNTFGEVNSAVLIPKVSGGRSVKIARGIRSESISPTKISVVYRNNATVTFDLINFYRR